MTLDPLQQVTPEPVKFVDPDLTAAGSRRAVVEFERLETLWFNTGTVCNIECVNCYIESSPSNDRLAFLTAAEVSRYLDEAAQLDLGTREIGFTGGEPFVNPQFLAMVEDALVRGCEVLVLTNAMQPMMRSKIQARLLALRERFKDRLHLRVSVDHYTRRLHEKERGPGSWDLMVEGLRWLAGNGFRLSIAGRTCWGEGEADARAGYAELFAREGLALDVTNPGQLVLFPEMDMKAEVPEITTECWGILGIEPSAMMCASSRMVVRRREAESPTVLSCTLLPYDSQFEMGETLRDALGSVRLNHPHCAKFCVLGGGSCSVGG